MYESLLDEEKPVSSFSNIDSFYNQPNLSENKHQLSGLDVSFQLGADIPSYPEHYNPIVEEEIKYKSVISLFFLCLFFPFFYTIALVLDIQKSYPTLLSKYKSIFLVLASFVFTSFFWTYMGLGFKILPKTGELEFTALLYIICCFTEAILKSSFYVNDPDYTLYRKNIDEIRLHIETPIKQEFTENTIQLSACIDQIQNQQLSGRLAIKITNTIFSILLSIVTEIYRFLLITHTEKINTNFIIFIISGSIVRAFIYYFLFHYMIETLIQIYFRMQISILFQALTSHFQSNKLKLPYIKLYTKDNLFGWMLMRSILLREYPSKLFVEIILSTTSILCLVLTFISTIYIFVAKTNIIKGNYALFVLMSITLSIIIFICTSIALYFSLQARNGFNQIYMLQLAKIGILVQPEPDQNAIILVNNLIEILQISQNEAVLFKILGFGISRSILTIFIGLVLSGFSTFIVNLFK